MSLNSSNILVLLFLVAFPSFAEPSQIYFKAENGTIEEVLKPPASRLSQFLEAEHLNNWCLKRNRTLTPIGTCVDAKDDCWNTIVLFAFNSDIENTHKLFGNWNSIISSPKDFCNISKPIEKVTIPTTTTEAPISISISELEVTVDSSSQELPPLTKPEGSQDRYWYWLGPILAAIVANLLIIPAALLIHRCMKKSPSGNSNAHGFLPYGLYNPFGLFSPPPCEIAHTGSAYENRETLEKV